MSLTPVLITGYEHGVVTPVTSGGGIADVIGNVAALSVQSTIKRTGSYALRTAPAGTASYINYTVATPTHVTASVYVYFGTLLSASAAVIYSNVTAGASPSVRFNQSTSKLALYNGSTYVDMTSVGTGTWYHIQCDWDCSTGTTTIKGRINEGTETSHSVVQAATTFTNISVGVGAASTGEVFHDDLIVSTTTADYPIDPGGVIGLSPASDGVHVTAANTIEFQDGTDVGNGTATTNAYTAVNTVPMGGTVTYLQQTTTGAYYANLKLSTAQTQIIGAEALLAYRSSSTTADKGACYIIDGDAGTTTVWGNPTTTADYSETSTFYKRKVMTAPTRGWQAGSINAYSWRVGNSDDIAPKPYWLDLMLQVAYSTATAGGSVTPGDGFQAQTGDAAGVYATYSAAPSDGFQAQTGDTGTVRAVYPVTPVDGFQAQTGDASTVSFTAAPVNVTPVDGLQAQTGDTANVYAGYPVTPTQGDQTQVGDTATVRTGYPVSPVDGFQSQVGDAAGVSYTPPSVNATPADGFQAQTGDAASVFTNYFASPVDGFQTQTGDAATLSGSIGITPIEGFQAQTGDTVTVRAVYPLTPDQGFQAQTGDACTVSYGSAPVSVTPADGFQAQVGDVAIVRAAYPLTPDKGYQAQTGDNAGIAVGYYINPEQGFQTQTGDLFTMAEVGAQTPYEPGIDVIKYVNSLWIYSSGVPIASSAEVEIKSEDPNGNILSQ